MKNVLITGKNSYVGTSLEKWLMKEPYNYKVNSISVREDLWKEIDFSSYDVIFHVAGIAHVSKNPRMEEFYYKVNRDLTIEIAKKAKNEGVKQFIFMSSIIVYGNSTGNNKIIDRNTEPSPSDFYGNSKLQAEQGLISLESNEFNIVILRPPMIYGKGSKGNYPRLANLAKKTPIFPDIVNQRSILHIDNLCELIRLIIESEDRGLFYPQNAELVQTSKLVRVIAEHYHHKIWFTKIVNPFIKSIFDMNLIKKIFGDLSYTKSLSNYDKGNYQIRNLEESIRLTED